MAKSNDVPKPLDVTKPTDIPPVNLPPFKPTPVDVPKPPDPFVNITVGEAIGLWWKWWWRNKAADAMAGLPADVLPAIGQIHSTVKTILWILGIAVLGGIIAWIIFGLF